MLDVVDRLKPLIIEIERSITPVLIVCDPVIRTALLAYFKDTDIHSMMMRRLHAIPFRA